MHKITKVYFFLLIIVLTLFNLNLSAIPKNKQNIRSFLDTKVKEVIEHSEGVPGLSSYEFDLIKDDIFKTWCDLLRKGVLEISGPDKDIRPHFVALQGIIEHILSCELQNEIKSLKGMIHTPMPATPLCSKGEVSKDLVDPSIEKDPKRLFTVKARTTIIRDFLYQGGFLYIIYPKEGMAGRTDEQQQIYKQELLNYPNNLFDRPLNCSSIPEELIGATYIFTDQSDETFAFSIKMTQAKDPKEIGNFGLWLDSLQNPKVNQRVQTILNFVEQNE